MGIKAEEDLLFEKLRISLPEAVCDGVVDEKSFFSARYRIVYILKEVNGGESWDLRKFLYDGGRPQTWDNIARWSKGIFSWEKEFYWEELQENNEKRRREQLKKIAAINLKKTSGKYIANKKQIHKAALLNREIINHQIKLYKADYIILCGTTNAFMESCYKDKKIVWQKTKRGVWYFVDGDSVVISFAHPEARISDNFLYYTLIDAVKEINCNRENFMQPK